MAKKARRPTTGDAGPSLTQAQVDALPDGTTIRVIWSGGNGPHEYTTRRTRWGQQGCEVDTTWHPLDFVGAEPLTQVWLVAPSTVGRAESVDSGRDPQGASGPVGQRGSGDA